MKILRNQIHNQTLNVHLYVTHYKPAFALVNIGLYFAWVKVVRFIPEFRILSHPQNPELGRILYM